MKVQPMAVDMIGEEPPIVQSSLNVTISDYGHDDGDLCAIESSEKNGSQELLEGSVALEEFMQDILEQEVDDAKEGVSFTETVDELTVGQECDKGKRSSKASGEGQNTLVDHFVEYIVNNADLKLVHEDGKEAPVLQSPTGKLSDSNAGTVVLFQDDNQHAPTPLHQK
jgi:hypothetical protein